MQYDLAVITDHNVWIWQYRSALFYRTRALACKKTRHNDLYVCAAPCIWMTVYNSFQDITIFLNFFVTVKLSVALS